MQSNQRIILICVLDRNIMATCGPDMICLLQEESITFTVHDFVRITTKGHDAINDYSVKYA